MTADGTGRTDGQRKAGGGTGRLPGQPGSGSRTGENNPRGRFPDGAPGEAGTQASRGHGGAAGTVGEGGTDRSQGGAFRPSSFGNPGAGTGRDNSTTTPGNSKTDGSAGTRGDGQFSGSSQNKGRGGEAGSGRSGGTGQNSGNVGRSDGGGGSPGSGQPGGRPGGQPPSPFRTFGRAAGAKGGSVGRRSSRQGFGIGSNRNGIGFERETTIHVSSRRIRVGSQPEISISRFKTFDELTERVLDDLDRHARTWGAPPANFHWVPVVKFVVSPGGNLYYERLHGPLRKLGISSTSEYPLDVPVYQKPPE